MDYLIPANSKKGRLILNVFRPFDLILFGSGVSVSVLLLMIFEMSTFLVAMLILSPGLITGFLVIPIPNYHNLLVVLIELYEFFTNQRTYKWRGWCYKDEFKQKRK